MIFFRKIREIGWARLKHILPLFIPWNVREDLTVDIILLRHEHCRRDHEENGAQQQWRQELFTERRNLCNSICHVVWPMGGRAPSKIGGPASRQVVMFEVEI